MDIIKSIMIKIESLKQQNKFNDAILLIEKSLIKYNSEYRLYEELADIHLYLWNHLKWLKSVNFALELNNKSATSNYLKWFILLSSDKVLEAIKYLELSNKYLCNNSEVLRNLWWAYTMIWNTDKWIMILKRALSLSPWDNLITEDLAMALIWIWKIKQWNWLLNKIQNK